MFSEFSFDDVKDGFAFVTMVFRWSAFFVVLFLFGFFAVLSSGFAYGGVFVF